jgi:heme/copper-type cytochrome/quinol oxidase subunit 3
MAADGFSAAADAAQVGAERLRTIDRNVLGVAFFISSEAVFFLALILAFVVYRGRDLAQSAGHLDLPRTALFTVALLSSSATVVMAERRMARADRRGAQLWLALTILLGLAFIANQAIEYTGLLRQDITPQSNLWATTFFTLTGFHGLHVIVGLVALTILLGIALAGDVTERRHSSLTALSLYWHFVDGIWILVFSLAYLWR